MSFLKIEDPIKRDLIVEEFLKTKKNIQEKFITERLGDISAQRELSKMLKPITETQKDIKESLVSELRPIKESLKDTGGPTTSSHCGTSRRRRRGRRSDACGKDRSQILSDYAAKQNVDKTFGIYKNPLDKLYYIGNTPIDIRNDNLIVGDEEYSRSENRVMLFCHSSPASSSASICH